MTISNPPTLQHEDEQAIDNLIAEFRICRALQKTVTHQWHNYLWKPANDR